MARRLLHLRHNFKLLSPIPHNLLQCRSYISDMRRSALRDRLLRSLRSEISYQTDFLPPAPPRPSYESFSIYDRPGEQWVRLLSTAVGEEVKVRASMLDGAVPSTRSGPDRPHISLLVEVSKGGPSDLVLSFECSAWPDALDVERVFPVRHGGPEPEQLYKGRQFRELDEEMQGAVHEYLEQKGVNDELATFLHSYMQNKERRELLRWLRNVESCVKK